MTTQETTEQEQAHQQRMFYYQYCAAIGRNLGSLLSTMNCPPHMIAIVGSQIISGIMPYMAEHDPEMARDTADELAAGFIDMCKRLKLGDTGDATDGASAQA